MASIKIAIDFGSSKTKIFEKDCGLVLVEPTLVALSEHTGGTQIKAFGIEAEQMEGKTGDITTLTTTAKSNLTAAVNELNTGVQAAATKTALEQGLATKQDTIGDLATIRSGAAAGATALQQNAIVTVAPSEAEQQTKAASYSLMVDTINDLA